ncbi:MAG: hypothetical protein ACK5VL_07295, partial [Brevundimonas sp.]
MLRRPARPSPALVRLGIAVALSTAAGVFLGLLGPFGSYRNGAAPERIAYFVGTFWVASLLYAVIVPAAAQAAAGARRPQWRWGPPVMAATPVPVAPRSPGGRGGGPAAQHEGEAHRVDVSPAVPAAARGGGGGGGGGGSRLAILAHV